MFKKQDGCCYNKILKGKIYHDSKKSKTRKNSCAFLRNRNNSNITSVFTKLFGYFRLEESREHLCCEWFDLSDQDYKLFPSGARSIDLRGPRNCAITTKLSWLKYCCETLVNRLTWLEEDCDTLLLKV